MTPMEMLSSPAESEIVFTFRDKTLETATTCVGVRFAFVMRVGVCSCGLACAPNSVCVSCRCIVTAPWAMQFHGLRAVYLDSEERC